MQANQTPEADPATCWCCGRAGQLLEPCCGHHPGDLVCADRAGCRDYLLAGLRAADAREAGTPARQADEEAPAMNTTTTPRDPDSGKLAAILGVLDAFDWATGDTQYALEKVEQIAISSRVVTGIDPGGQAVILPDDLAIVLAALADASQLRVDLAGAPCGGCEDSASDLCPAHEADLDRAGAYRELASRIGGAR